MCRDDTQTPGHTELQMSQEELLNLMTIMYMAIQLAISRSGELQETRKQLRKCTDFQAPLGHLPFSNAWRSPHV